MKASSLPKSNFMPQWPYCSGYYDGGDLGDRSETLQCAAVQVLALNLKLFSLGPGSGEAAVGQSSAWAHYCCLHGCRVKESLSMATCFSVSSAEIPLPRRVICEGESIIC